MALAVACAHDHDHDRHDHEYDYHGRTDADADADADAAVLVDEFVNEFLEPCFADQPKAPGVDLTSDPAAIATASKRFYSLAATATATATATVAVAPSPPEPLKTCPKSAARAVAPGRVGGLTVPAAPSACQLPRPASSSFSSLFSIPAPSASFAEAAAFSRGVASQTPPAAFSFPRRRSPSDFKTKKDYRRHVAIPRYLAKRKRRQWKREPTYSTRTTAALRRPRSNGKFSRSEAFVSVSELK